jgi:hypothetical protein
MKEEMYYGFADQEEVSRLIRKIKNGEHLKNNPVREEEVVSFFQFMVNGAEKIDEETKNGIKNILEVNA